MAQIRASYTKANLGQAVLTHMQGNAKGWALQMLDQYEMTDWPNWLDVTEGVSEETMTTPEL